MTKKLIRFIFLIQMRSTDFLCHGRVESGRKILETYTAHYGKYNTNDFTSGR